MTYLRDIFIYAALFGYFYNVSRSCNKVADPLADFAKKNDGSCMWQEEAPSFSTQILYRYSVAMNSILCAKKNISQLQFLLRLDLFLHE